MPILHKPEPESKESKKKLTAADYYHVGDNGYIDQGPYRGLSLDEAKELNKHQRSNYREKQRADDILEFQNSIRDATDEFATNYIVPAIKGAASFTAVGPIIGAADAYQSYKDGNTGMAIIGAGLEALPYGSKYITKGIKRLIPAVKSARKTGIGNVVSDIDWSKWNKEIPNNTKLMQEYAAIEQNAKKAGTWMKNSDGTPFKGTPEQFIQQNSENFKKAFGDNYKISYRGDKNKLSEFKSQADLGRDYIKDKYNLDEKTQSHLIDKLWDKNKDKLNTAIYTTDDITLAKEYARDGHLSELYTKLDNPKTTGTNQSFKVTTKDRQRLFDEGYNSMVTTKSSNYKGENVVFNSNRLKSLFGNNGMFDMSNPNIYKSIVGPTVGGILYNKTE